MHYKSKQIPSDNKVHGGNLRLRTTTFKDNFLCWNSFMSVDILLRSFHTLLISQKVAMHALHILHPGNSDETKFLKQIEISKNNASRTRIQKSKLRKRLLQELNLKVKVQHKKNSKPNWKGILIFFNRIWSSNTKYKI